METEIKKEERVIEHAHYSFDHLEMFGVFGKEVHLKGWVRFEDDDEQFDYHDAIIVLTRALFKKSMDYWMNEKAKFCKHYSHYCGAMGTITPTENGAVLVGYQNMNVWDKKKEDMVVKEFPIIVFTEISEVVDMEHG